MSQQLSYQHPGYAFLNRYGSLQGEEDVFYYVDFLRTEANLGDALPVNLSKIYQRFCIPAPIRVPLDEQQGILLNSYQGLILIRAADPIVRQRFTEGHELMELLFDAQADIQAEFNLEPWDEARKEQLCDAGAAELLMPRSSFTRQVARLGVSLAAARKFASIYQASLLATLIRMLELTEEGCALVLWRYALKPTEIRRDPSQAAPKLRIGWCKTNAQWQGGYIPKDKSIGADSLIAQAYQTGVAQIAETAFRWGGKQIDCHVEALPLKMGDQTQVISLLKLV
ncbi:ImmA/IrrE family metallo-endopeptidase [filamentous cyanobacterium LEGE 11480]|uniref:ImmA/IrrE family metallo-endopeptidase n=1 Tax=Romeriopsis navalis LEGE 11480 TaxID=2777977 RepID=A0A928VNM0_9CYAN|nr:ImmA/IrrE family metallo-endopeptidase [Romeriopsis navalis]MBE9031918.1 ImmA/IrrE family metallo-endopeptidase [Romeriopsis navalis LEGE 11480]